MNAGCKPSLFLPVMLAGALLFGGCAGIDVGPVADDDDANAGGFRYYEPAPFILVYSDGKGGLVSKLIYLPDTTRKMSIHPYAYLASNKTTLTFTNGMLVQSQSVIDETAVPKAVIETAKTVAMAAAKAMRFDNPPKNGEPLKEMPAPALFRIVIEKNGVRLVGGYGLGPDGKSRQDISVTVSQQPQEPNKEKPPDAGKEGEKK